MSICLSITLKVLKLVTLFVVQVATIDAGVISGGFKGSEPPPLKQEKDKKKF